MIKRYISFGIGVALLVSPGLVSAQSTSTNNAAIIAILEQLVATLIQELQALIAEKSSTLPWSTRA